jgi:hypothetical protein
VLAHVTDHPPRVDRRNQVEEVTTLKRLLLFSIAAYGVWTIVKRFRQQELEERVEETGAPKAPGRP